MNFDMDKKIIETESFLDEVFPLEDDVEADTDGMDQEIEAEAETSVDEPGEFEDVPDFSEVSEFDDL